jgi:DNA polymerase kappa
MRACVRAVQAFTENLPVRKIPGIGRVTERILEDGLNIHTCGQLRTLSAARLLTMVFHRGTALWMLRAGLGIGSAFDVDSDGEGEGEAAEHHDGRLGKSMSCERTFRATDSYPWLTVKCRGACEGACAQRL